MIDATTPLDHSELGQHGNRRGAAFYLDTLRYGQYLWQHQSAGRALLAITRGLYADVAADDPILREWPLPYAAIAWIIQHHPLDDFPGNPRLSYQHQACRMRGARSALRSARAWAAWALVVKHRPHLPGDPRCEEKSLSEITLLLQLHGHPTEATQWQSLILGQHG